MSNKLLYAYQAWGSKFDGDFHRITRLSSQPTAGQKAEWTTVGKLQVCKKTLFSQHKRDFLQRGKTAEYHRIVD